jgi:hypothetical protein
VNNQQHLKTARHEAGSALTLIPVMVLIIVLGAGLVVDSAIAFLAKRNAVEVAAQVANDAANGLSDPSIYGDGQATLDPTLVQSLVNRSFAVRRGVGSSLSISAPKITTIDGRVAVQIRVAGTGSYQFTRLFPGRGPTFKVTGASTAVVVER